MRTTSKRQQRVTAASAHAQYGWTCVCGKVCYGNGGKSSHKKACQQYCDRDLIRRADGSAETKPMGDTQ